MRKLPSWRATFDAPGDVGHYRTRGTRRMGTEATVPPLLAPRRYAVLTLALRKLGGLAESILCSTTAIHENPVTARSRLVWMLQQLILQRVVPAGSKLVVIVPS